MLTHFIAQAREVASSLLGVRHSLEAGGGDGEGEGDLAAEDVHRSGGL
jgi:hypothetical protein